MGYKRKMWILSKINELTEAQLRQFEKFLIKLLFGEKEVKA